jgi:MFS family permease
VVGVGSLLVCLGFGLMPLGSSMLFISFTVLVWTVGEMLALPMMNAVVAGRSGAGNRGRYMGMMTMAFAIAFMVAPLAGTWIYDRWGAETLWYGIGALGLPLLAGALALAGPLSRNASVERKPSESFRKILK